MKILLANYRYFVSGGPERYMFNVTNALISNGHEVIPFSINYTRNEQTPYAHYFVEPLGSRDEVLFSQQRRTLKIIGRTLIRLFYAPDVERSVHDLVMDTKPDLAYVLHYLRKLSPSVLVGLKRAGLPIVVRLSDYAMLCPEAHCLRDSQPCELCVTSNLVPSIRYRCIQNNLAASALNAIATWYHQFRHYFDLVDVFVVTNRFMYRMMVVAGFPESRLRFIPTFVDNGIFKSLPTNSRQDIVVFAGRLESIKGLHILVDAIAILATEHPDVAWKYKIAGRGDEEYVHSIRRKVEADGLEAKIDFLGEMQAIDLARLLSYASLSVIPSIWYENLPNALLESYACGTPVIASSLGSLKDAVVDGETGFLFKSGDAAQLANTLSYCWDHRDEIAEMGFKAQKLAETIYSQQQHLKSLASLFSELIEKQIRADV